MAPRGTAGSGEAVAKKAGRPTKASKPVKPGGAKTASRGRTAADKPAYSAPALEKGLDILELLATRSDALTPSQIAQLLGRSLQEVYRVVLALERRGYLVRPPGEEALVLSTQLFNLATMFPPFRRVVDTAQPIMNGLALETSQALHMAVLDGLNQRIIAQVDSPAAIAVRVRVGAASPAVRATSGRTILAFQSESVRKWIFAEAANSNEDTVLANARARIAVIAERGYELIEGEVLQGVTDISFPILSAAGTALAALTMPYLASPSSPVRFADAAVLVHRAASRITGVMGGSQPAFDPARLPGVAGG